MVAFETIEGLAHHTGITLSKKVKKQSTDEPKRRKLSREDRLLRKFKGTLRCDWCSRRSLAAPGRSWGDVPLEKWKEYVNAHQVWMCQRAECLHQRKDY